MAHPFLKMFLKALRDSDEEDNQVTAVATKLIKKGYSRQELAEILIGLKHSLIEDKERLIVTETIEELDLSDEQNDTD